MRVRNIRPWPQYIGPVLMQSDRQAKLVSWTHHVCQRLVQPQRLQQLKDGLHEEWYFAKSKSNKKCRMTHMPPNYIILQILHLTFTLWPSKSKFIRGLVLTKTYQNITHESSVINCSQQKGEKPFFTKVTFT